MSPGHPGQRGAISLYFYIGLIAQLCLWLMVLDRDTKPLKVRIDPICAANLLLRMKCDRIFGMNSSGPKLLLGRASDEEGRYEGRAGITRFPDGLSGLVDYYPE
jgi:hypothetical protein